MRSIAKELGCSHGALYYHFRTKAELFYAIVEDDLKELDDLIEIVATGSADFPYDFFMISLNNVHTF